MINTGSKAIWRSFCQSQCITGPRTSLRNVSGTAGKRRPALLDDRVMTRWGEREIGWTCVSMCNPGAAPMTDAKSHLGWLVEKKRGIEQLPLAESMHNGAGNGTARELAALVDSNDEEVKCYCHDHQSGGRGG